MATLFESKMAAVVGIAQAKTLTYADKVADTIEAETEKLWNKILGIISTKPIPVDAQTRIQNLLYEIYGLSIRQLDAGLADMATVAHSGASGSMITELPQAALSVALSKSPILEARLNPRQKRQVEKQLFPALSQDKVRQVVQQTTNGMGWKARIASISGLAPPGQLSALVVQGISQGQNVEQMARLMMPSVQNVRASARRIARTEGMRVAHESRMVAYDALGDMVVGYQIHATMDWRVRPHHAARNGTIYYKRPKPGQQSIANMPRPPLEADGTVAFNCRCYLTPVLDVDPDIENDPAAKALFTDNDKKLIPDPVTYDSWFQTASEQEKKWAVGARRLATVKAKMKPGESPTWSHFIDPVSGQLIDTQKLKNETSQRTQSRLDRMKDVLAKRKEIIVQVSRFGYLAQPQEPPAESFIPRIEPPKVPASPANLPPVTQATVTPPQLPKPVRIPPKPSKKPKPATASLKAIKRKRRKGKPKRN